MTIETLEGIVVEAFCLLNTTSLKNINDDGLYSFKNKSEMISELEEVLMRLKKLGLTQLKAIKTKCNYCYPTGKAYSFHHPVTGDFIIRYVIHQESEKVFRVEECRNIPPREDGMPF